MMGFFASKHSLVSKDKPNKANVKSRTQRHLEQVRRANQVVNIGLAWLAIVVLITLLIDSIWFSGFTVTKSVALGVSLNWLTYAIFTKFVFRYTGFSAKRHIVYQLYIGQIIKWLLTLSGFAAIFILVHPLTSFGVFFGYLVMQIGQIFILWRI